MNYELLKKINENTYTNFESLKNNIINKDKNINGTYRMIVDGIFVEINKKYKFVEDEFHLYAKFLDDNNALYYLINRLNLKQNIMSRLHSIKDSGNNTLHNSTIEKIFIKEESKEYFIAVMTLAQKYLTIECNQQICLSQKNIDEEFEMLYKQVKTAKEESNEILTKDEIYNELIKYESEINSKIKTSFSFDKNSIREISLIYKKILNVIIKSIMYKNNFSSIDDLKKTLYKDLYECYMMIDNFDLEEETNKYYIIETNSLIREYIYANFEKESFNIEFEPQDINELNDNEQIASAIENVESSNDKRNLITEICYIEKQKSFFANNKRYYEIEVRKAIDYGQKNNKKIIYSNKKIPDNYATKISMVIQNTKILNQDIEIYILVSNEVCIRPCEINKIVYIVTGKTIDCKRKNNFYVNLMNYLNKNNINLLDIVNMNEDDLTEARKEIYGIKESNETIPFINTLTKANRIIKNEEVGANVLRYLLYTMRNTVLNLQKSVNKLFKTEEPNDLYLLPGTLQFDDNPFGKSLLHHKVINEQLYKCIPNKIDYIGKQINKMEKFSKEEQTILVPLDILNIDNVESFIEENNQSTYQFYDLYKCNNINKYIINDKTYIYIEKNLNILNEIVNKIKRYSNDYINKKEYNELKNIDFNSEKIEITEEKLNIINKAFTNSKILLLYGEAGSGKTELMCNYFTKIFKDKSILFVSNTHSALNNMKKRVKDRIGLRNNFKFETIQSEILENKNYQIDVIIIDECNIISNIDMMKFLGKHNFDYCIMAGDTSQIDSIDLGNWFEISKNYANGNAITLTDKKRTDNEQLKELWKNVRNYDEKFYQNIEDMNILKPLNDNIFVPVSDDEIILCLNYGGRYGINNINKYFQNQESKRNCRQCIHKMDKFKVGDPIIFNDTATKIYEGTLYNNLKGHIKGIIEDNQKIIFELNIEKYSTKEEYQNISNIDFVASNSFENTSKIKLTILKEKNENDDDGTEDKKVVIPFDLGYSRSIHKAQGLEYESVKIIITPESEEIINNSIFYTAITRAKKSLQIYVTSKEKFMKLNLLKKSEEKYDVKIIEEHKDSMFDFVLNENDELPF